MSAPDRNDPPAAPGRDDPRLDAALSVTDARAVDWSRLETEHPDLERTWERLRFVEEVFAGFGGAPEEESPSRAAPLFTWGTLEVREKLGEGSFGEVYRAWDPALRREVALKLRRPGAAEGTLRWLDEARKLARVRHPHVLSVFGADRHRDRAGIWSELLEGETLETLLARGGPWGAREAAPVGIDLCQALAAVHAAGLVHGDVKTGNVMREGGPGAGERAGRIVLMDFGSAWEADRGAGSASLTPLATAPELLEGKAPDRSSDLYALGVLLYRLVTGRYPVEGNTLDALRRAHREGGRVPLRTRRPDLPPAFVAAIERATAADPAARYPDAASFEGALSASLAVAPAPAPRRARRWPWLAAAALTALAVGVGVRDGRRHPPRSASISSAQAPGPSGGGTAAVPAPIDADAVFFRSGSGEGPLETGGTVRPGDRVSLELHTAEPLYAYVLNEDETGSVYTLFPLAHALGLANPIPAGRHRLPGGDATRDLNWQVTSAGGKETMLVILSRRPLLPLETEIRAFAAATEGKEVEYPPVGDRTLAQLRGFGGLSVDPAPPSRGAGVLERIARETAALGNGEVWMKSVVFSGAP